MDTKKLSQDLKSYIIEQRRYLHQHPELSTKEYETTKYICAQLENMGITDITTFSDITGCIAVIKGNHPGKTVMLRADIDALPMQEQDVTKPYASQNPGVMHSCGHDCHTAMLLGAAKILAEHKEEIHGTVKLIFQMAEEIGTESRHYVEKGQLDDVDAIFGMHVWNLLPSGKINIEDGERMACSDRFIIKVNGKKAPGHEPQQGHDALVAAAAIVTAFQQLVSRVNNPDNTLVITTGMMNGGTAAGEVPSEIELVGTTRAFNKEFRKTLPDLLKETAEHIAQGYHCTVDCTYIFGPAPVINEHKNLNDIARNAASEIMGASALIPMEKQMGAEDFSVYLEKVPGLFAFLGTRNEEKGITSNHHSVDFDIDEDALPDGTALHVQFAIDFLKS